MQFGPSPVISTFSAMILALVFSGAATAQEKNASSKPAAVSSRLSCKPGFLQFGRVDVKRTKNLSVTLTNTGGTSVRISKIRRSTSVFSWGNQALPFTLAPGHSHTVKISFRPTAKGAVSGDVEFLSNAADSTIELHVHGTGVTGSLISVPSQISFGDVRVNSGKGEYETVKNSSSTSVTIFAVTMSETDFSTQGLSLPLTLGIGESYTFRAIFRPKSAGKKAGSLAVVSNAPDSTLKVSLLGSGTPGGQLRLGDATLDFGTVRVGQRKKLSGVLSASGAPVTVTSATSSSAEFSFSGVPFPIHLAAGQSVRFNVDFEPQMSGAASGKIYFHSNAADSQLAAALTGNGTAAQHSVTLGWSGSSTAVRGYNVYRSELSGRKYSKLNPALDQETAFTDTSVESGKTYYYVTTAVSKAGVESSYSNQVAAAIP